MSQSDRRRIAIGGFMIECNRFAPRTPKQSFLIDTWVEGDDLLAAIRGEPPRILGEHAGFFAEMDAYGPWDPVPLLDARSHPNGPVEAPVFAEVADGIVGRLQAALPVDAVFLVLHGAAVTTDDLDPEGTLLRRVRAVIGPKTPVVATLDLHVNLSSAMIEKADLLIAYRSNPHIDMIARGAEAARAMHRLLAGERFVHACARLPIVPPTITMLTRPATGPFADMMAEIDVLAEDPDIAAANLIGSFPHSDTPHNGIAVLISGKNGPALAAHARRIAEIGWRSRADFDPPFTSMDVAVEQAVRACREPDHPRIVLADLGDNPGGGGLGTELGLLRSLKETGSGPMVGGLVHDEEMAKAAHQTGIGGTLKWPAFGETFTIGHLADGITRGRRGWLQDTPIDLGPTAALQVGELTVVVSTHRMSPNDPMCFEHLGIDLSRYRVIIVKSRGHFRAGFDELVAQDDVIEVATPGLTSPDLRAMAWQSLPRPSWPIDGEVHWTPPDDSSVLIAPRRI
ncbi:MAG: M81 family metallopeptidase [Pseudomonadota bacterium]